MEVYAFSQSKSRGRQSKAGLMPVKTAVAISVIASRDSVQSMGGKGVWLLPVLFSLGGKSPRSPQQASQPVSPGSSTWPGLAALEAEGEEAGIRLCGVVESAPVGTRGEARPPTGRRHLYSSCTLQGVAVDRNFTCEQT